MYTELRQEANNGGVVVAVRHIESMIRMAEASARMHLRNHVSTDDVDLAISVLLNSVIKSQKYAIARSMEKKFYRYLTQKKDAHQLLEFTLRKLFQHAAHNVYARRSTEAGEPAEGAAQFIEVETDEFVSRARDMVKPALTNPTTTPSPKPMQNPNPNPNPNPSPSPYPDP